MVKELVELNFLLITSRQLLSSVQSVLDHFNEEHGIIHPYEQRISLELE